MNHFFKASYLTSQHIIYRWWGDGKCIDLLIYPQESKVRMAIRKIGIHNDRAPERFSSTRLQGPWQWLSYIFPYGAEQISKALYTHDVGEPLPLELLWGEASGSLVWKNLMWMDLNPKNVSKEMVDFRHLC